MSSEKEIPKIDYCRRKIFLAYNPNSIANSQQLYEWALSNILRPNLDHVYLFSVLHPQRMPCVPVVDNVWAFGLVGYANTYNVTSYHEEYQNYIKNEQESAKKTLQTISFELAAKNITSSLIIARGNAREEILNICETIKPDIILIGSSSSKSKIRSSTLKYVRNHVKNIPVQSDTDREELFRDKKDKNNKISEPRMSMQRIYHVIRRVKRQITPKSYDIDSEQIPNKPYRKLEG